MRRSTGLRGILPAAVLTQAGLLLQLPPLAARLPFLPAAWVTGALLLVFPGMWMGALVSRVLRWPPGGPCTPAPFVLWLAAAVASPMVVAAGHAALVAAGVWRGPLTAWSLWAAHAFLLEGAVVLCLVTKTPPLTPTGAARSWSTLVAMAAAFGLAGWGASRVVPPQQDQDMVLLCPVWGLFQELLPLGLESRMPYQFNKPLAFYYLVGAGVFLRGDAPLTQPFHQAATSALRVWRKTGRFPKDLIHHLREENISYFSSQPRLVSSARITLPVLAALMAGVLASLVRDLGVGPWGACVAAVTFMSLPEVFIRFSCADFTAPSLILMVLVAWLHMGDARRCRVPTFLAGLLLASTNHKALFLVPAVVVAELVTGVRERSWLAALTAVWQRGFVAGALVGTALYWAFGLAVDARIFVADHVLRDFLWRLSGRVDRTYPSLVQVWGQWVRNTSYLVVPGGCLALGFCAVRGRFLCAFSCAWFLLGASLASITDWKQTKHLMLSLPPVYLAVWWVWARAGGWARRGLALGILGVVVVNAYTLARIARDFSFLPPSKVW